MCELDNEIETNYCARCGTPFSALMKADEKPVHVEPSDAFRASLIYPGLGHRKIGRGADGLARGTLFALSLILLLVVVLSGVHSSGQDVMVVLAFAWTSALSFSPAPLRLGSMVGALLAIPPR
jgi:hypothetical protein